MPNKRDPNKRSISTWVPKELKDKLEKEAQKRGLTLTALVEEIYKKEIGDYDCFQK